MSRQPLEIRDATPDDADALLGLWSEAGREQATPRPVDEALRALAQIAADPDERIVLGITGGRLVAAVHLRRGPISPLHTEHVVHTSYLLVRPDQRRHGYARALLEVAVAWAEEKDIAHVSAIMSTGSRDTSRFLARLGLAPVATVRLASTALLRRKLTPEPIRPDGSRRQLGRVLAQRRSMRRAVPEES